MSPEGLLVILKFVFALVALVAIAVVVVRPILRMIREKPDISMMTPDYGSLLDEEESELQIPEGMGQDKADRSEMIQQARADPHTTSVLIKQWLKEKK